MGQQAVGAHCLAAPTDWVADELEDGVVDGLLQGQLNSRSIGRLIGGQFLAISYGSGEAPSAINTTK